MTPGNNEEHTSQPMPDDNAPLTADEEKILARALVATFIGNGFFRSYPDVMKGIRVTRPVSVAIAMLDQELTKDVSISDRVLANDHMEKLGLSLSNLPRAPVTLIDDQDDNIVFELDYENHGTAAERIVSALKAANGIAVISQADPEEPETVVVAGESSSTSNESGPRALLRDAILDGLAVQYGNLVAFILLDSTHANGVEQLKVTSDVANLLAIMLNEVVNTKVAPFRAPNS